MFCDTLDVCTQQGVEVAVLTEYTKELQAKIVAIQEQGENEKAREMERERRRSREAMIMIEALRVHEHICTPTYLRDECMLDHTRTLSAHALTDAYHICTCITDA